jgi:pyridoxamine 5'-phosphate oxidase
LQIRLQADVEILQGAQVASTWSAVPELSRAAYSRSPLPGQAIAKALDYAPQPDVAVFAVLRLNIQTMDLLHLGPDHRRARFSRASGWAGQWVAP